MSWRLLPVLLVAALVLPACRGQSLAWRVLDGQIARRHPGLPQTTPAALAARMARGERVVLLDARTADEYAVSHLRGARRVEPGASAAQIAAALADVSPNAPVVVYCSVGWRSADVAARLRDTGRSNVENLRGSIFRWAGEGREVVTGAPGRETVVRVVHPFDRTWGRLLRRDLRAPVD